MLLDIQTEKFPGESSRRHVYRVLRDNIMRLHLPPGLFLFDNIICEELGVSRTPVREAVFDLVEERLVDVFPKKRSLISLIDFTLVHEGIFLRSTVDSEVFALARGNLGPVATEALRRNLALQEEAARGGDPASFFLLENDFYRLLYAAVRMEHVWESVCAVTTHYERLRYFDLFIGGMRLKTVQEAGVCLLDSLCRDRDSVSAGSAPSTLSSFPNIQPYILEEYRTYFRNFEAL